MKLEFRLAFALIREDPAKVSPASDGSMQADVRQHVTAGSASGPHDDARATTGFVAAHGDGSGSRAPIGVGARAIEAPSAGHSGPLAARGHTYPG